MSSTTHLGTSTSSAAASTSAAPIGVFQGEDPLVYSPTDPFVLFTVQAVIILVTCRLLHWPLSKMRQPRVIAEVIGGIVLGPSVMGHIPNFSKTIFPAVAMPNLTLVANLGLVFFLFLVGLEVDLRIMIRNARIASAVSIASMILPFGLGAGIAVGIYNTFSVGASAPSFGIFLLFIGVSFAITAFPVLARILTELKLLHTTVGVIVLSAGVGNDVVGWVLLALTVALVNAGSGITILYVILCAMAMILLLCFGVRPLMIWYLKRSNALQQGPTEMMMAVILMLILVVAFYTDIIGIHPIFGGFLVGLIIPHDHGFAVKVTEKIEDFITTLFLPLYFALSGLKTNLSLLDNGITWAYTIGIICVALSSKIVAGTLAARLNRLLWRESFTVGVLMSCKGLVELIALNVGLSAGILSQRVFTMFVVMALVSTFLTTPIASFAYPPSYQRKVELWRAGEIDWDGNPIRNSDASSDDESKSEHQSLVQKCMMVLNRMEDLPAMMTLTKLLSTIPFERTTTSASGFLKIHCLRLMELTQRTSVVMKVSEGHFNRIDPIINVFRTFGNLNEAVVTAKIAIVPSDSFADSVFYQAQNSKSEMVIIPWRSSNIGNIPGFGIPSDEFIKHVLETVQSHVAIVIDTNLVPDDDNPREPSLSRSISVTSLRNRMIGQRATSYTGEIEPIRDGAVRLQEGHQVFLPYFGGKDDRAALIFVLQLLRGSDVKATVVRIRGVEPSDGKDSVTVPEPALTVETTQAVNAPTTPKKSSFSPLTSAMQKLIHRQTHGQASASTPVSSNNETVSDEEDEIQFTHLIDSVPSHLKPNLTVEHVITSVPAQYIVNRAKKETGTSSTNYHLVILGRGVKYPRTTKMSSLLRYDLQNLLRAGETPEMLGKSALGDAGEAMLLGGVNGTILVVQSPQVDEE